MENEVNVKRQGSETGGDGDSVKRLKRAAICDGGEAEDGEDMMAWLTLDDEAMTEISKLLESEAPPHQEGFRVRFIEDPYSPPVIFQSSAAYITINGNEESCGSSFSDLESSVMASIDMGGVTGVLGGWAKKEKGCAWGPDADEARGWMVENDATETEGLFVNDTYGCDLSNRWVDDCDHTDDSILANFLGDV